VTARARRVRLALPVLLAATWALTGCAAPSGAPPSASQRPAATVAAGDTPLLDVGAVPGLAVVTQSLPAGELAKDAAVPDLHEQLVSDGYLGGRERTFQGPSRHLSLVTSRALVFGSSTGAATFLAYVHAHAIGYFGLGTEVRPLVSAGRAGWVFLPAACACHLANPVLFGVVRSGDRLAWLEINGPAATLGALTDLLRPARSSTA